MGLMSSIYDGGEKAKDKNFQRGVDYANLPEGRVGVAVAGQLGGMMAGKAMGAAGFDTGEERKVKAFIALEKKHPSPKTSEDFINMANDAKNLGLQEVWVKAMEMAKDVQTTKTDRKTIKGDDGLQYFKDTGKRVFPNQKPKMDTTGMSVEKGYQLVTEADGSVRMIPIPGGPADNKSRAAEASQKAKNTGAVRSSQLVNDTIGKLRTLITKSKGDDADKIFGFAGMAGGYVPGSNRNDAESLATTIRSHIGFDRLDRMRKESPTGGALGQVSEMELKQLNATLGDLSFAQSEAQFLEILGQVENEYTYIMSKIVESGDGSFAQQTNKDPLNIGM